MAVRKSFGFKIPDTGQGRNIKKAVDALFTDDLPQTESLKIWPRGLRYSQHIAGRLPEQLQ